MLVAIIDDEKWLDKLVNFFKKEGIGNFVYSEVEAYDVICTNDIDKMIEMDGINIDDLTANEYEELKNYVLTEFISQSYDNWIVINADEALEKIRKREDLWD